MKIDPKSNGWNEYVEERASVLLHIKDYVDKDELDYQRVENARFVRDFVKRVLPKKNKTIVLAVFEIDKEEDNSFYERD